MAKQTTTTTTTTNNTPSDVVPAVALPSADLIIYRFDSLDAQLKATNTKLDGMNNSFLTKEEAANLKAERMAQMKILDMRLETLEREQKNLVATDNRQQGSIDTSRRMLTYGLTILGIIVAAVTTYLGLHK